MTHTKTAIEAKNDAQKLAFAPISFQVARALRNLKILDLIQKHRRTGIAVELLAEELKISLYGVKILLEFGETLELVINKDGLYYISKMGYFINSDEMTKVNMDFVNDVCYEGMLSLEESILENRPAGLKTLGNWETLYEGLSILPEVPKKSWFDFDHFYSDRAFPEVLPLVFKNKPKTLFDVGGNTGKWSFKCVEHDPDVQVTILDLPVQLNVALSNAKKANLEDRIGGFPIDLLNPENEFPFKPDAIWMSQFLDCFSEPEIVVILKMAKKAMRPDTELFILELFWDKQRFEASKFSLQATSIYFTVIANGNSKFYHSNDLKKCIELAGLKLKEEVNDLGVGHTLFRVSI